MVDAQPTLESIQQRLAAFRDDREWMQFHAPKDLALAVTVEAAELQELFLWTEGDDVLTRRRQEVEHEVADVLIQALNFCNATGIDAARAIATKIAVNEQRYPVDLARGTATKYTDL